MSAVATRVKMPRGTKISLSLVGALVLAVGTAAGVIPRLIDMGVDPYLIAPTLILSMAQRLVRKRCEGVGK